ncbi:lysophospholipid acyltransferase family protein [Spongiivirga sp. MCCC 1A20706]|uniref:lysophospholipid acyltransferase family protein n=1 Tax=Spongiivirga sp. MCCC 1A20706 TaxID=3160963 RepID=UPI0039778328
MRYLKYPFWLLYRIWFYILVTMPIILLFPLLVISILKESWYPFFFRLARIWSKIILYGMGFIPIIKRAQKLNWKDSYMLIANHTSMTDIMLMLLVAKSPFVFVGKAELAKIPLFGFFYKRTCILVDRSDAKSRNSAFYAAQRRLKQGLSICIFPEGGVPEDENILLDSFKNGAFRLAIDHQIPIVPISFADNKKRFSYTFFSGSPGKMRVKVHEFIETLDLDRSSVDTLRENSWKIIHDQLLTFNPQTEIAHT